MELNDETTFRNYRMDDWGLIWLISVSPQHQVFHSSILELSKTSFFRMYHTIVLNLSMKLQRYTRTCEIEDLDML